MTWSYAELSKMAKEHGGPEKLVEMLIQSGVNDGIKTGRRQMEPWLFVVAIAATGLTIAVQRGIDYFQSKKQPSKEEIEAVKQELIQGIKEYDESREREMTNTDEDDKEN